MTHWSVSTSSTASVCSAATLLPACKRAGARARVRDAPCACVQCTHTACAAPRSTALACARTQQRQRTRGCATRRRAGPRAGAAACVRLRALRHDGVEARCGRVTFAPRLSSIMAKSTQAHTRSSARAQALRARTHRADGRASRHALAPSWRSARRRTQQRTRTSIARPRASCFSSVMAKRTHAQCASHTHDSSARAQALRARAHRASAPSWRSIRAGGRQRCRQSNCAGAARCPGCSRCGPQRARVGCWCCAPLRPRPRVGVRVCRGCRCARTRARRAPASPQAELHARLDRQAQVHERQALGGVEVLLRGCCWQERARVRARAARSGRWVSCG